jgi:hypothetical protein
VTLGWALFALVWIPWVALNALATMPCDWSEPFVIRRQHRHWHRLQS